MPDELQTKADTEQVQQKKTDVLEPGVKRILWGGSGLLVLLLAFTFALPAGRILFLTGSLLSLVTLVIIALQSLIYSGQWKAMAEGLAIERSKTNPRLRVSNIRIENFAVGQSPVFITTIANDGYIDAVGVEIHIGIRLGDGRAFKWIEPQTVMIPARGEESYPLVTGASLSDQDMEGFKTKKFSIEVVVGIRFWNGSPNEPKDFCYRYCYKYLPWPAERRPNDVRQFFPCDFNPRMNISLRVSGVVAVASVVAANVVIERPPKPPEPEGDKNGEDEERDGQAN